GVQKPVPVQVQPHLHRLTGRVVPHDPVLRGQGLDVLLSDGHFLLLLAHAGSTSSSSSGVTRSGRTARMVSLSNRMYTYPPDADKTTPSPPGWSCARTLSPRCTLMFRRPPSRARCCTTGTSTRTCGVQATPRPRSRPTSTTLRGSAGRRWLRGRQRSLCGCGARAHERGSPRRAGAPPHARG